VRRRACLSVPAASEKMVAKARRIEVDEIVLDLEDAVVPGAKSRARARVVEALADPDWCCGGVAVRVNPARTPWCHHDLIAIAGTAGAAGSVVVPKVESGADLAFVDRLLAGVEAEHGAARPLRVQALIESAAGLERVDEIATAAERLEALILGYADLAASLGRSSGAARRFDLWIAAQDRVLTAARAAGLQAIDGPWLGTAVDEPFRAAARHAADLGFDGKWAIHPSQVPELEAAFTPSSDETAWAERVLAALASTASGVVALDGQMLDEAVAVAARRILARAGR
jgi:citrate lyase subunit beta/citryl-CoA lyase